MSKVNVEDEKYLEILRDFLRMPLVAKPVLDFFAMKYNTEIHNGGNNKRFVYIPAKRNKPVLLIAHADTVSNSDDFTVKLYVFSS